MYYHCYKMELMTSVNSVALKLQKEVKERKKNQESNFQEKWAWTNTELKVQMHTANSFSGNNLIESSK